MIEYSLQDFGSVSLPVMAKVYGPDDNSATHGMSLNCIEYNLWRSTMTGDIKVRQLQYLKA